MQYPKPKPSKRKRADVSSRNVKLSPQDYLDLLELTQTERAELFKAAIEDMASKGILAPKEAKEYLTNVEKWLLELLEI